MHRKRWVTLMGLALFAIPLQFLVTPGKALASDYWVSAIEHSSTWWGCSAGVYVFNTTPTSGYHKVNSIWCQVTGPPGLPQAAECGWCDHNQAGQPSVPTFFSCMMVDGDMTTARHSSSLAYPDTHSFKMRYAGNHYWNFYLNSSYVCSGYHYLLQKGWPGAQAENHYSTDNNYGWFTVLRRNTSSLGEDWSYWTTLEEFVDNEAHYYLLETSDHEFQSYPL